MSYIENLIKNCEAAKKARPVREFELKNLSELDGIKAAIYIIEQVDGDSEKTFADFLAYKSKNERRCARANAPSKVLYVGSSTTGIRKRIEEHQGSGHRDTYSLQLAHWFTGTYRITIKLFSEPKEVLQIIEDDLSDRLKPAFGKQGGNNK